MAINFPASPSIGDQVTAGSIVWKYDGEKWVTIRSLFDRGVISPGTATAPGLPILGDEDTGIFSPGANQLAVTTGGTQRLLIDASGNTTVAGDFTVNGTTTTIDSQTLIVEDKNIEMGSVTTPTDTTADGGGITLKGASDKTINWVQSTGCWTFNQPTNFNDHVQIDSSGKVGIGTTSPSNTLHISGAGTVARLESSSSTTALRFANSAANNGYIKYISQDLTFTTADTERLRIDSSGNVGIGIAPTAKLHLGGTNPNLVFGSSGNELTYLQRYNNDFYVFNKETSGSMLFGTANNERMRIESSGKVGIGTTNPISPLSISDGGAHGVEFHPNSGGQGRLLAYNRSTSSYIGMKYDANDHRFQINGSEKARIDSSGNVGIGTTTPATKLHMASTAAGGDAHFTNASGQNCLLEIAGNGNTIGSSSALYGQDSSNNVYGGWARGAHPVLFGTNNTERMRIDNTGKTKFTPSSSSVATFEIQQGTTNTDSIRLQSGGTANTYLETRGYLGQVFFVDTSERMRIDSSGRVGIGTTSPSERLTVGNTGNNTKLLVSSNYEAALELQNGGGSEVNVINSAGSGNLSFRVSNSEKMRIDSSGRLLVGTSSTSESARAILQGNSFSSTGGCILKLSRGSATPNDGGDLGNLQFTDSNHGFAANISAKRDGGTWTSGVSQPTRLEFATTADGASSPTERMRISANGTATFNSTLSANGGIVVVTTIDPPVYVRKNGTGGNIIQGRNAGGAEVFRVQQNGDTYNANNVFTALSDIKLKENIVDAKSQWDDIKVLRPVNYNFKAETGQETHTQLGLIAQEVELVSPGLVSESPDRDEENNDLGTITKSVNYSVLYMKAVKALQEAMERIEQLETEMAEVKAQLQA